MGLHSQRQKQQRYTPALASFPCFRHSAISIQFNHRTFHNSSQCSAESSKDEKELEDKDSTESSAKIAKIGGFVNFSLMVLKTGAGYVCGSYGLMASAADSATDLVGDAVLLWALGAARAPADENFPWGFGRIETVASLGTGVIMIAAAGSLGWHSAEQLLISLAPYLNFETASHVIDFVEENLMLGLSAATISILAKEWLYHITMRAARLQGGSRMLEAHAHHHRSDSLSAGAALVGLLGVAVGVPGTDALAGLLVCGLIGKQGVEISYGALQELADKGIELEDLEEMAETVRRVPGIEGIKKIRGRNLGPFIELEVTVFVNPWLPISAANDIGLEVRERVRETHKKAALCSVHVAPLRMQLPSTTDISYVPSGTSVTQSHAARRALTEKLCRETAERFPGVEQVNRVDVHRLYDTPTPQSSDGVDMSVISQSSAMAKFVVNVLVTMSPDQPMSSMADLRTQGEQLQLQLENITLEDGSRPVLEADIHADLTVIDSENRDWRRKS